MKIAQVAPLYESVPPKLYGGTERVVSYLTEEQVREGHDVSLFASGDSVTAARLFSECPHALRLDDKVTVQSVAFGSEAAKYGLSQGDAVLAVLVPTKRPDPFWFTIPAFLLLGGIVFLQRRRKRRRAVAAAA